jgi:hypothetical protein
VLHPGCGWKVQRHARHPVSNFKPKTKGEP